MCIRDRSGVIEVSLFCGTVNSSSRQKNRAVKEIIAYDDLYLASQKYAYNYFTMEKPVMELNEQYPVLLLTGPRQVG